MFCRILGDVGEGRKRKEGRKRLSSNLTIAFTLFGRKRNPKRTLTLENPNPKKP
jgi:hypothetical protein